MAVLYFSRSRRCCSRQHRESSTSNAFTLRAVFGSLITHRICAGCKPDTGALIFAHIEHVNQVTSSLSAHLKKTMAGMTRALLKDGLAGEGQTATMRHRDNGVRFPRIRLFKGIGTRRSEQPTAVRRKPIVLWSQGALALSRPPTVDPQRPEDKKTFPEFINPNQERQSELAPTAGRLRCLMRYRNENRNDYNEDRRAHLN